MPRVKGGVVSRKRRKRVLKLAKGYFGSKHTLYKTANEQVMKSLLISISHILEFEEYNELKYQIRRV